MAPKKPADKTGRYNYTARNNRGAMVSGQISAESETGAARRLQAMGLAPLTVRRPTQTSKLGSTTIGKGKRVKAKNLAVFARQFGTMVNAGLPLIRAVQAIGEQTDHPRLAATLPEVRADLERGTSFSASLAKHEDVFPPLMVGMIASGEVSGSLGAAMESVADTYGKEAALRAKTISAMLYPGIVLALALVMVTGMLLFVVPRFAEIFTQLGGELPLPTKVLVLASKLMFIVGPILLIAGFFFTIWWRKNKNTRKVREIIDPLKLRMPIFGKFFQKIALARFSRTFSSLLDSGVPLIQTLDIVSTTSGSIVIGDAIDDIRREVTAGKPIATPMSTHAVFPPLVIQMVSTGEETGALPDMLTKVADFYEQEVDTAADALASIIEPVLIVFLAGVVGTMVLALYLPIFKVFDLIK